MDTFIEVSEAVAWFYKQRQKQIKAKVPKDAAGIGLQCLLSGGNRAGKKGDKNKQLRTHFNRQGVRANITGPYGNRTITCRGFLGRYIHSKATKDGYRAALVD